jgi:hypothetical protein
MTFGIPDTARDDAADDDTAADDTAADSALLMLFAPLPL